MNDCIRLLATDEHIHHPMLEDLEAADGLAELLADLRVFNGQREQGVDCTGRFRTQGDYRLIDDLLDLGADSVGGAKQRLCTYGDVFESYLGGKAAIDRSRRPGCETFRLRGNDERTEHSWCSASTGQMRYHDDPIRPWCSDYQRFAARDPIARTVANGGSADVSQNPPVARFPARKRKDLLPANDRR